MPQGVQAAVRALQAGSPVVFPTDTVYGVGVAIAHTDNPAALCELKGRPVDKPIAWLVGDIGDITRYGRDVDDTVMHIAREFWPGPLTLVVKASDKVPPAFHANRDTIGLRMPASDIARRLIAAVGCPVATTSANIAGAPAPVSFDDIDVAVLEAAAASIDAGPCIGGCASTVIDCTGGFPVVLREGDISIDDIRSRL